MKQINSNKHFLLKLLLFSFVIGLVYENKPKTVSPRRSLISLKEGLAIIHPLIISVSIEKIIELMRQFPPDTGYNIAKRIIEDKDSTLNVHDKQQLIFGLVQAFKDQPEAQMKFFDLLYAYEEIPKGPGLLINIVNDDYGTIIPSFLKWVQQKQQDYPELIDIGRKALYSAIDNNEVNALKGLADNGIQIDANQASDLLWHVVSTNKNANFIPFLAEKGADLSISKDGHTLVTKATEYNNQATVKALITALKEKGTPKKKITEYINRFVSPAVGSPIQISIQKGYIPLEIYLRNEGAHEK